MKKLMMMFVAVAGLGACDMQIQEDAPVERVAPLSEGDGAAPSPNRPPDWEIRWRCHNGDPICIERYSGDVLPDITCSDIPKPKNCHPIVR